VRTETLIDRLFDFDADIIKRSVTSLCFMQAARVISDRHSMPALCSVFDMCISVSGLPSVRPFAPQILSLIKYLMMVTNPVPPASGCSRHTGM